MQNILVIVIVVAAALYVGRRIYLAVTSKKASCGCDSKCDSCELFDEDRCDEKKP